MYSYIQQDDDTILVSHSGELTKPTCFVECTAYSMKETIFWERLMEGDLYLQSMHTWAK